MMKRLFFSIAILLSSITANATNYFEKYEDIKNNFEYKTNSNLGVDNSFMLQNFGSNTISRMLITPYFRKNIFDNLSGKTNLNFSMNIVRFNPHKPTNIAKKEKIATLFNSYDANYNELYELYFSYKLPNKYNFITLGLGQIPFSKFDSPISSDLQSYYFFNTSLAQNATFTYPTSGIGGFIELTLNKDIIFSLGAIEASNPLAEGMRFDNLNKYSSFVSINYQPKYKNKYNGSYSLLLYDKPYVKKAPFSSQGWSLYLAQDISKKHSLFFRLNSANSQYPTINRSYSFGILIDNPFNLSSKDKFALGYSINKINPKAFDDKIYNRYEYIIESYYTHNINKQMSITPNIQLYLNRALSDDNKLSAVFSLNMQFNF